MPGLSSGGFLTLEGNYSDWTIYDSFDDTTIDPYYYETAAIFNKDETIMMLVSPDIAKKYTIATKVLGSSLFDTYIVAGFRFGLAYIHSVLKTYIVLVDDASDNVHVIKNGVIVKSLTYANLGIDSGFIGGTYISPSGKYLAVMGRRTATGNSGVVVLVGS